MLHFLLEEFRNYCDYRTIQYQVEYFHRYLLPQRLHLYQLNKEHKLMLLVEMRNVEEFLTIYQVHQSLDFYKHKEN